jgi:hypothetical protein
LGFLDEQRAFWRVFRCIVLAQLALMTSRPSETNSIIIRGIKPANLGYESSLSVGDIWLDSNNLKTVPLGAQPELFPETALHIARHLCVSASTFLPSQLHNLPFTGDSTGNSSAFRLIGLGLR